MTETELDRLIADLGIPVHKPTLIGRLVELAVHALRGCRFVRLQLFDPASNRFIELEMICRDCDAVTAGDGRLDRGNDQR